MSPSLPSKAFKPMKYLTADKMREPREQNSAFQRVSKFLEKPDESPEQSQVTTIQQERLLLSPLKIDRDHQIAELVKLYDTKKKRANRRIVRGRASAEVDRSRVKLYSTDILTRAHLQHKIYSHKKSQKEQFKRTAKQIRQLADLDRLSQGTFSEMMEEVVPLSPKLNHSSYADVQTMRVILHDPSQEPKEYFRLVDH